MYCIHTCIHTFIHTYIHTLMHIIGAGSGRGSEGLAAALGGGVPRVTIEQGGGVVGRDLAASARMPQPGA
jgi:hypothetical protein